MELLWKASFSASSLHAAACFHEGLPVVDSDLAAQLAPAVSELQRELQTCGLSSDLMLPQLAGLAAEFENNRQLVEIAGRRLLGARAIPEATVTRVAGAIADLEAKLLKLRPHLVDELAVRSRPLREQWEARGPGLLHTVARLTDEAFVASSAEVVVVNPFVGGHGWAHLKTNRVTFEAVLTNPHANLPESLRLAWLLAQLNIDVPMFSDPIPGPRLPRVASLATLPLVLAAAESVELATLTLATLRQAIDCWHFPPGLPEDGAQRLLDWWETYTSSNTGWTVALAALDAMFCASNRG